MACAVASDELLFIRSKIQFFESKSQPHCRSSCRSLRCLSDQRYNFLKANHNCLSTYTISRKVVYQIKDTIFWKQITTPKFRQWKWTALFIRSKIQFFESKSQQRSFRGLTIVGCLSDQRYNFLKANHNHQGCSIGSTVVVYQIKDTIFWKQITTWRRKQYELTMLFIRSKIQFFESKSQPIRVSLEFLVSCLSDQRYNFLKANHNYSGEGILGKIVVYQIKDTIFWKQITTR